MGLAAAIAGVGAAASIGGALISGGAAESAAHTQADAANRAADLQTERYNTTRGDLMPYNTAGQGANAQISAMGPFNFAPTEANLETTPGYQFNLYQGEKGAANSAAARGLSGSGAALKGAATYATGLADSTYQNQFNNALQRYNTNLGRLQGQASLGENAGAQTGNFGTQAASNAGQALIGGANASAAGTVGVANAVSGGLNGLGNAFLTSQFLGQGGMYGGDPYGTYASAYGASPGAFSGADPLANPFG